MTAEAGGLRDRFILRACFDVIADGLAALGWFGNQPATILNDVGEAVPNPHYQGATTHRAHAPIDFIGKPVKTTVQIPLNTITVVADSYDDEEAELGSSATNNRTGVLVDVYGESDAFSREVSGDIRDIVRGKLPAIARDRPIIQVLDYTLATPAPLFHVEVEKVRVDQAHHFEEPWLQFWRSVSFELVDEAS